MTSTDRYGDVEEGSRMPKFLNDRTNSTHVPVLRPEARRDLQ